MQVTPEELKLISDYVKSLCGVVLDSSKAYLVESRLRPLVQELGLNSYRELYFKAKSDATGRLPNRIVDAITTQETSFFRDQSPFELLKHKLLPEHADRCAKASPLGPYSLNVWSAASSTGQEAYSIGISIKQVYQDLSKWRIRILGTDISDAAVAEASYARYSQLALERGFPREQINTYFKPVDGMWQVNDEIRAMATFRKFNLLGPLTGLGRFDIIYCRNVAIYFSPENRRTLFNNLADQLNPDGYLVIGSTESLLGITERFKRLEYLNSICYQVTNPA